MNVRLIDADALIDNMEGHVTTMYVCSTTIEARAKGEMKRTCISDVANAPTIPAIPVDWLKEQRDKRRAAAAAHSRISSMTVLEAINVVLELWEKEQEAQ